MMMGRIRHEDVRERTVAALSQRFDLDEAHAGRVAGTKPFPMLAADGEPLTLRVRMAGSPITP
jgi:exopolyphosphatase/pppGpp-phosphohydrolase